MKYVAQPQNSNICGQCCIAMISGYGLDDVLMLMGSKRTKTRDLRWALLFFGIDCGRRLKRGSPGSGTAILKFIHPDKKSHWVLWKDGKFYDPAAGVYKKTPKYLEASKQTSYLEILS